MKKIIPIVVLSFVFLTGCGEDSDIGQIIQERQEASFEESVTSWLSDLSAYQAVANVTYISNKNVNEYVINHVATAEGQYFIEVTRPEHVAGSVTVSNSQYIFQAHRGLNYRLDLGNVDENETKERTSLLLTNFAAAFLASDQISITKVEDIATLTVVIDSGNSYINSLSLVVTNDFQPISLTTFDINNNQRIIVEYLEFVSNPNIDTSIFEIESDQAISDDNDQDDDVDDSDEN